MSTPEDNALQDFDLDLLLGSAPCTSSVTENASIQQDVYVNQNLNQPERTEQASVECRMCPLLRRLNEESKKDYDQIKRQYLKLGQDYADLHYESKKNALDAMECSNSFEKQSEEMKILRQENISQASLNSVTNTLYQAELCNSRQLVNLVEQQVNEITNLKNTIESYILASKEKNRDISSFKSKIKIYEEDLFKFAVIIKRLIDKKDRDRETQRKITKYINKKFNADLENTDIESVDTGRGSSLSTYSPAYSIINFSPLTENFDQKIMKDASTSTLQTKETENVEQKNMKDASTSTLQTKEIENFEQKNMKDASTSTLLTNETFHLSDHIEQKIASVDTASSPISFVDDIEQKITTIDTASSPISFIDDTKQKIPSVDTASSPISFVDDMNQKITSVNTASSPISFVDDMNQKITSVNTASSPISFVDDMNQKITSVNTASSPISFGDDMNQKITSVNTASSPISFVDDMNQKITSVNTASSPISFVEDMNQKITSINTASSPISFVDDMNQKITSVNTASSPISFVEDMNQKITSVNTASSPISFVEDKNQKITSVNTASSPISFVDEMNQKITSVNTASSPISFVEDMNQKITSVNTASSPISFVDDMNKKITSVNTASSPISFVDNSLQNMSKENFTDIVSGFSGIRCPENRTKINNLEFTPKSMDMANSPIYIANPSSPAAMSPSWESTTSPIELSSLEFADVTIPANEITDISRSLELNVPFKPAPVTSLVVKTPEKTRVHCPLISFNILETSIDKTPDMRRSLPPSDSPRLTVKTPDMTMQLNSAAVTKQADLMSRPNDIYDVERQSHTTKMPEMAKPIETTAFINEEDKTTRSKHMISKENNSVSVITKTPDFNPLINAAYVRRSVIQTPFRPMKHADVRRQMTTNQLDETKQNETIKNFSSAKSLHENLKEIQSHITQNDNLDTDDLEVGMILNKFRLDWNALSPMSVTPDLDEEGLLQTNTDVRNDETEKQPLEYSRSQISIESGSLLVIPPNYKLTVPENKSNNRKHKINEDNPSHLKKNKVLKPVSIPPIIPSPIHKNNERQSDIVISVGISDKNTKSNFEIEMPQTLSELASNVSSLESQSDLQYESNSLSHTSRYQLTESQESIKKDYLLKINQIDSVISKPANGQTSERIKSPSLAAQSKTENVPQTQTKIKSSPRDNTLISKESQVNTRKPPERLTSEKEKHKKQSVPQTQTKLQSSLNNLSVSKESHSTCQPSERRRSERISSAIVLGQIKTSCVLQNQTNPQSSPKGDVSISKESQTNTYQPPERRRSERIKSTTSPVKSNSVTQNQTKLQSSPINNEANSKKSETHTCPPTEIRRSERIKSTFSPVKKRLIDIISNSNQPHSNTRTDCHSILSNPEYGRKRPISRVITAQTDNKHSKLQKKSECDTNKFNFENICRRDKFSYSDSKPCKQQISRVEASGSTNLKSVPNNNQSEKISERIPTVTIIKDFNYAAASKTTKLADDTTGSEAINAVNLADKAQSDIKHSNSQKNSECDTNKLNATEIISEDKFTYSLPKQRISRVKASVSSNNKSVPNNNQFENISERKAAETIIKDLSYAAAWKRTKLADDTIASETINVVNLADKAQSDIKHSNSQKNSECDANKLNATEIISEDKFTYSLPKQRISRVKASVSSNNKSVPNNNQFENISERKAAETIIKDLSYAAAWKRTKLADDTIASETINVVNLADKAQSDNKHSNSQKDSECDTNKLNSSEIISEDKFTYSYSKPNQGISGVKASVSSNNKSVPNNYQPVNISERKSETIIKDLSYTAALKRNKLVDGTKGFFIKPGQNMNENYYNKMSITHVSPSAKNMNPKFNLKNETTAATFTTKENNHVALSEKERSQNEHGRYRADYNDIDMFNTDNISNTNNIYNTNNNNLKTHRNKMNKKRGNDWTNNVLDKMLFKYGSQRNYLNKSDNMKMNEDQIACLINDAVSRCVNLSAYPNKYYETVQNAVGELQRHSNNNISWITSGFTKYITSDHRKAEFVPGKKDRYDGFKQFPTKYGMALTRILDCADKNGLRIWEPVLTTCRYVLFNLDRKAVPRMDVVETVTNLFVNMCQFEGRENPKSIVLFMLAAMYCSKYKAIIMIQQCLDLVPEILPREYEMEKSVDGIKPLLRVLIYLLHFFVCEDKMGKAKYLRLTLQRRYGYNACIDNDTTILHMLKEEIKNMRDNYFDIEMLETSILILAKRKSPMWCHTNIVQKILLPILKGQSYASKAGYRFAIVIMLKLLKPYNDGMIVATQEVVNPLLRLLEQPHLEELKEDIVCGLVRLNLKHVKDRINMFLANWNPPSVSPMLESALAKYIQRMTLQSWNEVYKELRPQ